MIEILILGILFFTILVCFAGAYLGSNMIMGLGGFFMLMVGMYLLTVEEVHILLSLIPIITAFIIIYGASTSG